MGITCSSLQGLACQVDKFQSQQAGRLDQAWFVALVDQGKQTERRGIWSAIERLADQRRDSAGRTAFAAAYADRDSHGLVTDHCVTGIAGRMPWKPPTGSACEIWIVVSSPPCVLKRRVSSA